MLRTSRAGVPERTPRQRGEIWLVAFDSSVGGELRKTRPAMIISNDDANAVLNRVRVVPVSSHAEVLYPAEASIVLNARRRKAMADQITTVSVLRLRRRMGRLGHGDIEAVERVARLQLGL
jgi:mRNA interferase MazF